MRRALEELGPAFVKLGQILAGRADLFGQRNGRSGKAVLTEDGPLRIEVPRDRDGSFEPLLIPKHERLRRGPVCCSG